MISLRQITYALAVGRTLHFKQAADACAVSPSALSTAITEMERQLGFTLFERDNKKVLVTTLRLEAKRCWKNSTQLSCKWMIWTS